MKIIWVTLNGEDVLNLGQFDNFIRAPNYPPSLKPEDNEWGMLIDSASNIIRFLVEPACQIK